MALLLFYSFTGCDTVSSFYVKGKAYDESEKELKEKMVSLIFLSCLGKPLPV